VLILPLGPPQSALREAAADLVRQSDNPKFQNSTFMNFVKQIGSGEVELDQAGKTVGFL
jgi:hypothetical protein